jgi:uncharacterized protein (TIGR03382 family)
MPTVPHPDALPLSYSAPDREPRRHSRLGVAALAVFIFSAVTATLLFLATKPPDPGALPIPAVLAGAAVSYGGPALAVLLGLVALAAHGRRRRGGPALAAVALGAGMLVLLGVIFAAFHS